MDKHGPAPHVLVFYWCVLLIDVTSMRLGRFLDRRFARKSKPKPRDARGHAVEQVQVFIRNSS
jgi:hypothetical protein